MPKLFYLYGIVPEDAPPPPRELRGLEGEPVYLLPAGRLAAAVSEVPAAEYAEEAVNDRLGDLEWVGERAVAHERVLTWLSDRVPVVPLSPFSLHQGADAVRARVATDAEQLTAALARLAGRREWGVKVWRVDAELTRHLAELSPRVAGFQEELEAAAPGRRFLLAKKMDGLKAEELRSVSTETARQVFLELREAAEDAVRIPLPARGAEAERSLILHSAYLVPEPEFSAFQARVSDLAHRLQPRGFVFEFTGPWPAYHFATPDADGERTDA